MFNSVSGCAAKKSRQAFAACGWLKTVTIPASVREIGFAAFGGCPTPDTVNYGGSEDDWNKIIFGDEVFTDSDGKTLTPTIKYNYAPPKPINVCPWCGGQHVGFFQGIIGWFHSIFARIFGARYCTSQQKLDTKTKRLKIFHPR